MITSTTYQKKKWVSRLRHTYNLSGCASMNILRTVNFACSQSILKSDIIHRGSTAYMQRIFMQQKRVISRISIAAIIHFHYADKFFRWHVVIIPSFISVRSCVLDIKKTIFITQLVISLLLETNIQKSFKHSVNKNKKVSFLEKYKTYLYINRKTGKRPQVSQKDIDSFQCFSQLHMSQDPVFYSSQPTNPIFKHV